MTTKYELTKQIHELLPKVCEINNINQINILTCFCINKNGYIHHISRINTDNHLEYLPAIQAAQIRQILIGLETVLVENQKTYPAEAYCHDWLDGLNPLFECEPETVYRELIEVLKELLK